MSRLDTVVIHQPDFLPYLGFFHRLLNADLYIVLDQVQFVNNGKECWHHRDKIKTEKGAQWLTVSVRKAPLKTGINQILLSDTVNWRERHLNFISRSYRQAHFYDEVFPKIQKLYEYSEDRLVDFNLKGLKMMFELLGVDIEIKLASELAPEGNKNELLVDLLKKVQAKRYLSGIGARDYFSEGPYRRAGIKVVWQEFEHPRYPQLYGDFIPFLSSIDLLFNCGITKSREILRSTSQ